ncbi:MAG: glycerate kinase [Anaerolineae bacterium]|jgi:hydroxypyruvate reductase|nr:glycerate kinase [Anaerolineae bacterium]MDH7473437.1 glycerate kinase [Anaerolineae bacterium]
MSKNESRRKSIATIQAAALAAVAPDAAVKRQLYLEGDVLCAGGRSYPLADYDRIFVVGGGKAGAPMAVAVEAVLGERITAGLVNVKHGYTLPATALSRIQIVEAGHPVPDEAGRQGAEHIAQMLTGLTERDLVLVLISGGGSALLTLPSPGISLSDVQTLTGILLRCGATINEINAVRKHISQIKGGQLARLAHPATVVALILSDVVGNPLDVIASGPTVPDPTTFAEAWAVLERYGITDEVPDSITSRLRAGLAGQVPETPKPGDLVFTRVQNVIVGSNEIAAQAVVDEAREQGFSALLLSTFIEGEAREVARVFAGIAKGMAEHGWPLKPPACLVAGGETTVTIRGRGKGGRNQELALAAALAIHGWQNVAVVGLATDGTDGPTDAAGAIAWGDTVTRARELGLDAAAYLANNDAYHFFQALGDLIITGPTNTNVNDLIFVFAFQ